MNLVPRFLLGDLDLTDYPFAVEFGAQYGSPENVTEVLNSLLADGELLSSTRTSNREMTLTVIVEGSDMLALAEAEATLVREASKPANTLTIDPGDGFGVPTVFDTFRVGINFDRNDRHEGALVRRFELTIPALPYGRSESLTTEVAEGIPSIGTAVNNCESTAGWSSPVATYTPAPAAMVAVSGTDYVEGAGSIAVEPHRVTEIAGGSPRTYLNEATLAQSIAIPSGGYVSFAMKLDKPLTDYGTSGATYLESLTITRGSTPTTYSIEGTEGWTGPRSFGIFSRQALADGWVRWTWRESSATTITAISWKAVQSESQAVPRGYPKLRVDQIAVAETATLGNQVLKTLEVGGSARTTGAIHVAAPSDEIALGRVLAYTVPQRKVAVGFRPDLRQWVLPGAQTTTIDGVDALSGITSNYDAAGSPVFEVPASLFTSGAYTVAARTRTGGSTINFTVEATLMIDGESVGVEEVRASGSSPAATWEMRIVGTMYLPPVAIAGADGDAKVRFRVKGNVTLDEIYVLPVVGDLTIVDCGEGPVGSGASSHLWIDSPSPEQPQGGYWRSASPSRLNALSAWSTTTVPGVHSFDPGPMLAFIACTGAQGPTVSFDHYERWLAHAAR